LNTTEATFRQLEQENKGLLQEIIHLENDKDLASLEVTKLGGRPITESQLEQLLAPPPPKMPTPNSESPAIRDNSTPDAVIDSNNASDPEILSSASSDSPNDSSRSQPETNRSEKEKPRLLVVDDNNELRGLLQQALESEYDVLDSPNGFDALTKILKEKQSYDLIITDLNMPKVNGITLLENLPSNVPTIVISAFIDKPEFKKALSRLNPKEILQKPFQMSTLRQAIKNALPKKTDL
jgi:CheY-like chemotaxis protein